MTYSYNEVRAQLNVVMTTGREFSTFHPASVREGFIWCESRLDTQHTPHFDSTKAFKQKVKLAYRGVNREVLVPLLREPHDSGIDSDDPERALVRAQRVYELVHLTETSESSDEDPIIMAPCFKRPRKEIDLLVNMEEGRIEPGSVIVMSPRRRSRDGSRPVSPSSPDRSSPLLFEVELTASDEDDDASVLEVVIPHQTKMKPITNVPEFFQFLCRLTCCMSL